MVNQEKLLRLREVITENLRVQLAEQSIDYINVGTALQDACSRQNHAIFARRGCGKTLLLHNSSRALKPDMKSVYLNCEDFKRHSFPNVLIEILAALFRQLDKNLQGWFGKKKKSKEIIKEIIKKLEKLQRSADVQDEDVSRRSSAESNLSSTANAGIDIEQFQLKGSLSSQSKERLDVDRSFKVHREKLQELDQWLPELKESIRTFFKSPTLNSCGTSHPPDQQHG